MPQPQRTFTDAAGASWLVLDNGHRIRLPEGGSGGSEGPPGEPGAPGAPGAPGPPGPTDVSRDLGNAATLGTDDLIFVPFPGTAGGTIPSTIGHVLTAIDEVGGGEWMVPSPTVSEGEPIEAPENPLTVNMGTVAGRQSCIAYVAGAVTTITATIQSTRVPGSKSVQFTLIQPAMVTARATFYLVQSANSTKGLFAGVGVEDELGAYLYSDDFAAVGGSYGIGAAYLKSATGGATYVPGASIWKRYLQPGTYNVYLRAWIDAVDATSVKSLGYGTIELEIDPGMTYLTGQRP